MKTTATQQTVETAIERVNLEHGYKIELNRADQKGKHFHFTIKSKSGIPGARLSATGRNLAAASWHAHGYVMEEIFKIEPEAVIYSMGNRIEPGFSWEDRNIGSILNPVNYSQTSILSGKE
jgi:hypothetical protein